MTTTKVTVLTTDDLITLNNEAIRTKRNRALVEDIDTKLDPHGLHMVSWSMIHNDREMRVMLFMKFHGREEPVEGMLDMSFEAFNGLRTATQDDDGNWVVS